MGIDKGITRPPQVKDLQHEIQSAVVDENGKPVWSVRIECLNSKLTDALTRLIAGVLFSNNFFIQGLEESLFPKKPEEEAKPEVSNGS